MINNDKPKSPYVTVYSSVLPKSHRELAFLVLPPSAETCLCWCQCEQRDGCQGTSDSPWAATHCDC